MSSGSVEDAGLKGAGGVQGDQAGAFREVIVFAVGAGVSTVCQQHIVVDSGIAIIMVVPTESRDKPGLFHCAEHTRVEFGAADGFCPLSYIVGDFGVFGEGDVEEGDGRGTRVKAGGMADPFDLLGFEPGVAEGGVVGRVGVGVEEEEVEGGGAAAVDRDLEIGELAGGGEGVDGVAPGGDDGGELGEGEAVFVVMVTVDDGPGAGVGVEAADYQLHQGVGGGGVEKIARDCDKVGIGLADEAVHSREDVRDLVGVEELEVEVRKLEDPEGAVRAEAKFAIARRGAGGEESQQSDDYDDELFHTAKLTKS